MRILVAEDDAGLRSTLERVLRASGCVVESVGDGALAARALCASHYEVAVVEWQLPRLSGLEVIEQARSGGVRTPVLMLTNVDTTADRISGAGGGADDYLVKPFDLQELLARLRALERRPLAAFAPVLQCGDLCLDPATREATVDGVPVDLTRIELAMLEVLLWSAPSTVTARSMADHLWEARAGDVGPETIPVHLARLRAKLAGSTARIDSVRGAGNWIHAE
ncbi:MAG TPA: response regulator transcription factor [Acidimicrobiales bacterium]